MDFSLLPFFKPKGIVVIGTSTFPEKLGYGVARNLIQSGYQGAIHFVSQKPGKLFEQPIYTNLNQVPNPVELAILIVPPNATPQVLKDCGQRGIKAAIIVTGGFREVGAEGEALEQQCLEIAQKHGMRLLGPNCIGTINTHLPLDTTFLQPPMPTRGGIGFISHSGAFAASIVDWARSQDFGFSQIVSLGNQADVNETDMLLILADDPHTNVIVLYMESVSDGILFVDVAREVTQRKPVIALKVGRFESGQKAAASHTGALAASDVAFDAAFDKAGILRADTTEQMFDWARGLDMLATNARYSTTKNVAILTNAGGPGVIAADALEQNGLSLAQLGESTLKAISSTLPPSASVHNPVDMLASASPDDYADCLKILLEDSNVDAAMVILPPPPMYNAEIVAEKLIEVINQFEKPVVIALLGSTLVEDARSTFELANIPTYPFPERAASALGALFSRAEFLGRKQEIKQKSSTLPAIPPSPTIDELLTAYDITTVPMKLAKDKTEATLFANEIGYPVVMKIASPDILHKSDIGGVVLNIQNAEFLRRAYTQIIERARESTPDAHIDGVHIQRQIPGGQEVIVGMVRDPLFGPLMMFGSGGVEVEGLKDVSFALAPLNQAEAEKMIRKTWAGKKLKGFRHIPTTDESAVVDVLIKLSKLGLENINIEEIEINPLRVLSQGAVAVDVRVKWK